MTHLTAVFPCELSYGSTSAPIYRTEVVVAYSGKEERNQGWTYPLHSFAIDLGNRTQTELETFGDYYHAAAGRANTFNFTDPRDYK